MTVDTLSLAQQLREAELSSTQAEAIATAIGRALIEGAATKADIQIVRGEIEQTKLELRGEIEQTKLELRSELEKLRSSMLMWFIGTVLTLTAVIIAVVKL